MISVDANDSLRTAQCLDRTYRKMVRQYPANFDRNQNALHNIMRW